MPVCRLVAFGIVRVVNGLLCSFACGGCAMSLDAVPIWPVPRPEETLTKPKADKLARKIRHHWAILGYRVTTWLEPIRIMGEDGKTHGIGLYGVRSDMIGGKPKARIKDYEIGEHVTSEVEVYE